MDELIDILNSDGTPTGKTAMKSEAHRKGLFHPTIHVWFYTQDGRILLQQRGRNKSTFPLLWDVSVAGHIGAGEEIALAALREVQEEIGLAIEAKDLEKIGFFKAFHSHSETLIDREFHHSFLCELKVPLAQLRKQESEVEALRLIPLDQFAREHGSDRYVPSSTDYYTKVVTEIQKKLQGL
ncbi:NUDIX domain-containing protein [Flavobacteriaceae bacterium 3-367]